VVTDTDDTLLVLITSWKAVVVSLVVRLFLVPVVAGTYALSTKLGLFLDPILTQMLPPDVIDKLEEFLQVWQPLKRAGPPHTKWRRRPDIHSLEMLQYLKGRLTRDLYYHYDAAAKTLDYYLYQAVFYAVLFRLACIWSSDITGFRAGSLFRAILSPVLGGTIAQQREWFGASAADLFTDESVIQLSFGFLRSFLAFESNVLPKSLHKLVMKLGVIVFLFFGLKSLVSYLVWGVYLKREEEEFQQNWKRYDDAPPVLGGTRMKDSVGGCSGTKCVCCCCKYWVETETDVHGLTVASTN